MGADCRRVWSHHHAIRGPGCAHVPRLRPACGGSKGRGLQECRWNATGGQLCNELQGGSQSPDRVEQLLDDKDVKRKGGRFCDSHLSYTLDLALRVEGYKADR